MQQSVCSRCELIGPLKSVPATGHDMQTRTVLAPTCTAAGMEQEVCTHCGETGALTNLPALGHDYAAVVTEPTCETPGFTTHTCGRCGDHFTDSYIAPTGHTYGDGVVTREPTCTREGEMTYTCSCGKTHTEPIAKLAHSYVPQIVEPTCTELGYTAYVCAHCGDRTTGDYVRELGHDWNAGTVVQAPRLTKEGLLEQTCRRCGAEQKTVLPVLESCAGTICPSHDYHDAPEFGHWSHAGIDYTLELGLFRGTSDTEFSPNVAMTRAMLVTVLYRLDGQKEPTGTNPFTDVEPDSWYTEAVGRGERDRPRHGRRHVCPGGGDHARADGSHPVSLCGLSRRRYDDGCRSCGLPGRGARQRLCPRGAGLGRGPRPYQRRGAERRELARAAGGCDPRAGGNDPHALPEAEISEISNDNAQRRSSGRRCCR